MKKTRTWETLFFYMGIIGGIAAAGAAAIVRLTSVRMAGWGFPCFLNTYFHIPCPGCGGTRAIEYLLQGRLWDSFLAHPLIVYAAGCYLYFMVSYSVVTFIKKETFSAGRLPFGRGLLLGAGILVAVQWAGKLLYGWN